MESLIKSFVIGSSAFVTLPRLVPAIFVPKDVSNYSYKNLSIVIPIWFGFMAVMANLLRTGLDIPLLTSIIIIGIIGIIIAVSFTRWMPLYNFSPQKWKLYYIRTGIISLGISYATIYLLEKYLK